MSADAITEIREICKKYRIFSWGELRQTEEMLLDAPVTSVYVTTGEDEYSYTPALQNLARISGAPSYILLLYLMSNQKVLNLTDKDLNEIIKVYALISIVG